ncbi:MAG TPA: phosphotransferase, partial [Pyrinomonadaceae bacterium]
VPHTPVEFLSAESQVELGRIARRIHAIRPSGADLQRLSPPAPWHEWICRRIRARVASAGRYMPLPDMEKVERALVAALGSRVEHACVLLHLDLRAPNLALSEHRIAAVFDLGNAIAGDPYLELARIRGCDLLTPEFLRGYGEEPERLERNRHVLDAYELDLAALLVVVSREEINDDQLHEQMLKRTETLLARLTAGHGVER